MKRILFSATVYTHLAAFHKPYIQLLQQKGYEIHAAANPDHGRKAEIEELGVTCWDIPFPRSPFNILQNIKSTKMLKRIFSKNKYELIHVHTPIASFLVRLLGKKFQQPCILYTAHGFHFYKGGNALRNHLYYWAEKIASRWTDGLITINEEDYQAAIKMGFVENKSVFFVHGVGVDFELFKSRYSNNIRKELGIPDNDIVIASVAELNKNKNHIYLLSCWKELHVKFPNCHFLLVGTGEDECFLKNYVKENKLENIHFLGFRHDVPGILESCDFVVLLSRREGLPLCIMEAMASGKPALVSNVRGCRDLIEHGKSGFIVELDKKDDLKKYMVKLIEDKQLRNQMGGYSREQVREYKIDHVIQEMESIYQLFLK